MFAESGLMRWLQQDVLLETGSVLQRRGRVRRLVARLEEELTVAEVRQLFRRGTGVMEIHNIYIFEIFENKVLICILIENDQNSKGEKMNI